ncbi:MAG TPA: DUF3108 domain-containing protein [Bryobacteraceae bacterium]|nr:DUF3108 domain-containing protein [Bryobacteraceae bacterium]
MLVFRCAPIVCVLATLLSASPPVQDGDESLYYGVEWRFIYAGNAGLNLHRGVDAESISVHLQSAGLVSKLFTLNDNYNAQLSGDTFCARSVELDALEGKRHRHTAARFDYDRGKVAWVERDLLKNTVVKSGDTDLPAACVSDVIGGLYVLRQKRLEPGQILQLPLSNGRKAANVRIEVMNREEIATAKMGKFKTIRCDAGIFNGVLYSRNAGMSVWLTDDDRHLPVQIRIRMPFVIGTITLQLEKESHAP